MIVIEPTLTSHRPPQPPAVIAVQSGVVNSMSTPSRLAISVATSMSKPWYLPSGVSSDCGGYFGSVETTSLPAFLILSSRPPAIGATLAAVDGASADGAAAEGAAADGAAMRRGRGRTASARRTGSDDDGDGRHHGQASTKGHVSSFSERTVGCRG